MVSIAVESRKPAKRRFYVLFAVACAVVAFGGFAPTYWLQLPARTFVGTPLLHLHAALFFAWLLLLVSQAVLVATGHLSSHRAWGLIGIALATAMVFVGIAAAIGTLNAGLSEGYGDRSRAFFIVPMSGILLFAVFFIAAIMNREKAEAHKRLIILATLSLLQAAMGRIFFSIITGGGPGLRPGLGSPPPLEAVLVPSLMPELFIVVAMIYDWRTRGRPHTVWIIGAIVFTSVVVLRGLVADAPAWLAIADFFSAFGR